MKNTIKGRKKREIGDGSALPDSLYQTYPSDYDEFADEYPLEKRFLGKCIKRLLKNLPQVIKRSYKLF